MKKKGIALLLCALLLVFAGCASPMKNEAASTEAPAMAPMPVAAPMEAAVQNSAGWGSPEREMLDMAVEEAGYDASDSTGETAPSGATGQNHGAKIIRNASISLETREFLAHVQHVQRRAEEMGGYVADSYISGKEPESYYDSGRYANITVRIPVESLDSFLADARGLATVISESVHGEDITANYRDTESRLEVHTTQRDRILELLKTADTMEDIIALETELSRLTYEIESLTGSLRRWDDLVAYSTVNVDLREIPATLPVAGTDTFGTRVSEGFRKTLNGMAVFFENAAVFLISALPVLLVLGAIAVVVVLLVRRSTKRQDARRAEQGGYAPASTGYGTGEVQSKKKAKKNAAGEKPENE